MRIRLTRRWWRRASRRRARWVFEASANAVDASSRSPHSSRLLSCARAVGWSPARAVSRRPQGEAELRLGRQAATADKYAASISGLLSLGQRGRIMAARPAPRTSVLICVAVRSRRLGGEGAPPTGPGVRAQRNVAPSFHPSTSSVTNSRFPQKQQVQRPLDRHPQPSRLGSLISKPAQPPGDEPGEHTQNLDLYAHRGIVRSIVENLNASRVALPAA